MDIDDIGFTRRKLLSAGVGGLGALGLAAGGARVIAGDSVDYTRRTVAQTDGGDLIVDWMESYNGDTLESQDTATDSDGDPLVTLENVTPGDSGMLAFGLTLDEDSSADSVQVQLRFELFDDLENGLSEPEIRAGDTAGDGGELPEFVDVFAWYDTGFTVDGTPIYGACDGSFDSATDEELLDGTLAAVTSDDWIDLDGCLDRGDNLCLGLTWALPEDLGGVDDNVVQTDEATFGIKFGADPEPC